MKDLSCLLEENGSCPCGNGHRLDLKMIKNVNGYNGQIQLYYSVRLFSLVVERALFSVMLLILIFMVVLLIFMVVLLILRIFMIFYSKKHMGC